MVFDHHFCNYCIGKIIYKFFSNGYVCITESPFFQLSFNKYFHGVKKTWIITGEKTTITTLMITSFLPLFSNSTTSFYQTEKFELQTMLHCCWIYLDVTCCFDMFQENTTSSESGLLDVIAKPFTTTTTTTKPIIQQKVLYTIAEIYITEPVVWNQWTSLGHGNLLLLLLT